MYSAEKDFTERTKELLREYEKNPEKKHEISLLMNCCVGLLLMPKEQQSFNRINKEERLNEEWGISESDIEIDSLSKSVKDTIRHLRNSVAHGHFKFKAFDDKNEIERIVFTDCGVTIDVAVEQFMKFMFMLVDKCNLLIKIQ